MNLPSGLVFYLDYKYGTNKTPFGFAPTSQSQVGTLQGVTNTVGAEASDGLYGAGRFGYTVNDVNVVLTGASGNSPYTTGSLSAAGVFTAGKDKMNNTAFSIFTNFNTEFSSSITGKSFQVLRVASSGLTDADLNGVRAFNVSGSGIVTVYPEFTTADASYIYFLVETAATPAIPVAASRVEVAYHKNPSASTRGDFEDYGATGTAGAPLDIPEINLEMRSEAIVAKTRKLKAIWSPEFAQDLNAYHSIDAEAELTSMLSEYISQEIDLEILDMLIQNAQTTERWSARIGYQYDAATRSFVDGATQGQAYNQGTWFQTLGTKIQKVSNQIHRLTLRGGANFLVCSPTVATILESIPGYAADTDGDKMQFAMGVQKVGAINNRFQVYKNPYMTENTILMGYRGSQFLETGAVYAPYIPLIMTPLVYDPTNFTPRKGVMTRYAKKMVRPEFYGKVFVHGLDRV